MSLHGTRTWLLIGATACALATGVTLAFERHHRAQGVRPTVLDDQDLWAQERGRLARHGAQAIALLGTSRMVYGIDPRHLRARLPGHRPVMLAINGTYPMAALRDLAQDEGFNGIVIVDTDAAGLRDEYRELQQPHVEHFHQGFGPSRAVHRRVLTAWQRRAVVADPNYGALAAVQRALFGQPAPQVRYAVTGADRAGALDFTRVDPRPVAEHFARERRALLQRQPAPPPEVWRRSLAPVAGWVRAIQARGGQVLFFGMPTSGGQRDADEAAYPRALYWDRIEAAVGAPVVHADDLPPLAGLQTPDGSHVDGRDRARLTDGLVLALSQRLRLPR